MMKFRLSLALATVLALLSPLSQAADTASPPPPPLDHEMQAVLDALAGLHPKPIETLTPAEARLQPGLADGARLVMQRQAIDPRDPRGVRVKDITLPGGLPARLYFPAPMNRHEPLPVVIYYHGGGFVLGSLDADDADDATPRETAKGARAIVVAVGYRLAPENKFPAAHDDAFGAYRWVLANAARFGGDARRVAVMGESAGGNLAIDTAIAARDAQLPLPACEVLIYPLAGTDLTTPSYQQAADTLPLSKAKMAWFFGQLAGSPQDLQDPRLDLTKPDLAGLPPTTLIAAEADPLRSEDEALAARLATAGVKTDAKTYRGVTHGFFGMGLVVGKAADAEDRVNADLRAAFKK